MKGAAAVLALLVVALSGENGHANMAPEEFATKAAVKMLQTPDHFIEWFYGGAIITEGMFRIGEVFGIDMSRYTNKYLDQFKTDPTQFGYMILHDKTIPFFHNVGDQVPLFSTNYLLRAMNDSGQPNYPDSVRTEDLRIAAAGGYQYVLSFPIHLPDGTPTRAYGWKTEHNNTHTFLWCDDMYMGLTPLVRIAAYQHDTAPIMSAAKWIRTFAAHLTDAYDGLYRHGANTVDGRQSCCKWGRANGWAILAKLEVLEAMEIVPGLNTTDDYVAVRELFVNHARAVRRFQAYPDGRWRQLVNETSTFLETSASSMFLSALARGVVNGWLDKDEFGLSIDAAWRGLVKTIEKDGTITGVCNGEGIETVSSKYENCSTEYLTSSNGGLGTVLYAASDYQRYLNFIAGEPLTKRGQQQNIVDIPFVNSEDIVEEMPMEDIVESNGEFNVDAEKILDVLRFYKKENSQLKMENSVMEKAQNQWKKWLQKA